MANFGHLQAPVLSKIFKTFCCNFYGSPIWDFNSTGFRKICTTWNIGVRTVLKLPFDTHCYFLGPLLRQNHIRHQLHVRGIRFLYNMYHSNNTIVRRCVNHAIVDVLVLNLLFYEVSALIFISIRYVKLFNKFH